MDGLFASFIPASFPALALAHFLALISPGPDFFLIIGHAARRRLRGSFFICAGIALGNAVYILLAVAGWSAAKEHPGLYSLLEVAGALYLFWLGCMLIRSGRRSAAFVIGDPPPLPPAKQLGMGLSSALLNPKNAVFYLSLMTVIIGENATLPQQAFAGLWMTFLVFTWDTGIAALVSHPRAQRFLQNKIPHIELAAGGILVLFALGFAGKLAVAAWQGA